LIILIHKTNTLIKLTIFLKFLEKVEKCKGAYGDRRSNLLSMSSDSGFSETHRRIRREATSADHEMKQPNIRR